MTQTITQAIAAMTTAHQNCDSGMYDGWTEHKVTVTPSFSGFDITVSGRNRNGIKEYIADMFYTALSAPYVENQS